MRIGIHLPQFGRALAARGVQRAAEDLSLDDLYVSEHLVNPREQPDSALFFLDPVQTLASAAAATTRTGLRASVLLGPEYCSPLGLANTLASLDYKSGGRMTPGSASDGRRGNATPGAVTSIIAGSASTK